MDEAILAMFCVLAMAIDEPTNDELGERLNEVRGSSIRFVGQADNQLAKLTAKPHRHRYSPAVACIARSLAEAVTTCEHHTTHIDHADRRIQQFTNPSDGGTRHFL
ncbi:hypothetical protein HC891_15810 [Candidatus Gracilibacteria bacterium]|nr:hypothetical protein [Candidatus Gracilibacteria bacterium]